MTKNKEVCTICLQGIKNPVCNKCRLKEFIYWIEDRKIKKNLKEKIINELNFLNDDFGSDIKCIICNKNYSNTCGYCFFMEILKVLEKNNISEKDLDSFRDIFNYRPTTEEKLLNHLV